MDFSHTMDKKTHLTTKRIEKKLKIKTAKHSYVTFS